MQLLLPQTFRITTLAFQEQMALQGRCCSVRSWFKRR